MNPATAVLLGRYIAYFIIGSCAGFLAVGFWYVLYWIVDYSLVWTFFVYIFLTGFQHSINIFSSYTGKRRNDGKTGG